MSNRFVQDNHVSNEAARFTLISGTGLRIAEALELRYEDLRLEAKEFTVRGKGQRERTVHLVGTESYAALRGFLRRHKITSGYIFRPEQSKRRGDTSERPVDYTVIARAWVEYCKQAGVKATIHQLRHTYATERLNAGARIEAIQQQLGHRNLQTTQRYARISDMAVRQALESAQSNSKAR